MRCLQVLLIIWTFYSQSDAKDTCQMISDGDTQPPSSWEEVNECYQCEGWYQTIGNAGSDMSSTPTSTHAWCAEEDGDYLLVNFPEGTKLAGFTVSSHLPKDGYLSAHVNYTGLLGTESNAMDSLGSKTFLINLDGNTRKETFRIHPVATSMKMHFKSPEPDTCLTFQFFSCDYQDDSKRKRSLSRWLLGGRRMFRRWCAIQNPLTECEKGCLVYQKDYRGCYTCECNLKKTCKFEGDLCVDSQNRDPMEREYGYRKDPEGVMRGGFIENRWNTIWSDYKSGDKFIIPYVLTDSLSDKAKEAIRSAMNDMQKESCMIFSPRSGQQYYLNIIAGGGCYSYIGNIKSDKGQELSIGYGCEYKGTIQHELLHALGFHHEQSRSDRDDYVEILTENIMEGAISNFAVRETRSFGSPYDYQSVMHYGSKAFSANGKDTIRPKKDPSIQLGQRDGMSKEDIKQLNLMYQCKSETTSPETVTTTTTTIKTTATSTTSAPSTISTSSTTSTSATTTRSTETTSTTASSSTPEITSTPKECANKHWNDFQCESWKKYGYCDEFEEYMTENCAKACGLCATLDCYDVMIHCGSLKDFCESSSDALFKQFMIKNCKKTCNIC